MVSTRFPVPLRSGGTDREAALRIAFVGTFPPTQCGLATFTESMVRSISHLGRAVEPVVIRLIQPNEPTGGAARATVDWIAGDAASFDQVRDTVEDVDLVILQHEYGIYGGPDGDEVLDLLRTTTTPSIVVLHTVLADPTAHQRAVLEEVIELADVTVTQTEAARWRLGNYAITDPKRVIVIPHGAWTEPGTGEQRHHDKPLVLSWGLVGPGKGLEHGIAAMARLADLTPMPRYLIAGETHPKVRAAQGERYSCPMTPPTRSPPGSWWRPSLPGSPSSPRGSPTLSKHWHRGQVCSCATATTRRWPMRSAESSRAPTWPTRCATRPPAWARVCAGLSSPSGTSR